VSDLTSEISQFARRETESFDNRKEISGCFSHQALELLNNKLDRSQLEPSNLINRLLRGSDTGLKIKMMPGAGFGRGVFGVTTALSIDPLSDTAAMAGLCRVRIPRAYPNGQISVLDAQISNAEAVIRNFGARMTDEKIRLTFVVDEDKNMCLTDRYLLLFSPDWIHLLFELPLVEVKEVHLSISELSVMCGARKGRFHFRNQVEGKQASHFITTQSFLLTTFKVSLLS
jgi:hypothetical protein